ncbi:unnamed protein product [Protopolystoma xenopodis]|uniref:Uncharacterized protein n=1 Tax=Protopolystoma xenopodis TaxID=117903 RepID=A0A3S5AT87_9PLAT|nr:unnamed protein product [Protopolystoma xenopodis]
MTLMDSPLVQGIPPEVTYYLTERNSTPGFLASLVLNFLQTETMLM